METKKGIIGFYRRKFYFFYSFAVAFFGVNIYKSNSFSADSNEEEYLSGASIQELNVSIENDGSVTVDGNKTKQRIDLLNNSDELRLLVLDNPGRYYSKVKVTLNLPKYIAENTKHEFLGIHGVGETSSKVAGAKEIVYEATNVSSEATLTLVAQLPKGTINPPLARKIFRLLEQVKGSYWFVIALLLPLLLFC